MIERRIVRGFSAVGVGLLVLLAVGTGLAEAIDGPHSPLQLLGPFRGVVTCPGPVTIGTVNLTAGSLLLLDIDAGIYASPLDSVIEIVGPAPSTAIAAENDDDPSFTLDSALGFLVPTTGAYTIRVRDFGNECGSDYWFLLNGTLLP